jgi:hypothetical protein
MTDETKEAAKYVACDKNGEELLEDKVLRASTRIT